VLHRHPTSARRKGILSVLLGALAILLASGALGIGVNHWSPRGIPIFPERTQDEISFDLPPGLVSISLKEALEAFQARSALFVDTRGAEEYAQGHVPGAISLPAREFEERFPYLAEQVELAASVVMYCEGIECGDAVEAAERLFEALGRDVLVFEVGWRAWEEAGYPVAQGPQQ
jgi:rhodanese-related sulfurtransferase